MSFVLAVLCPPADDLHHQPADGAGASTAVLLQLAMEGVQLLLCHLEALRPAPHPGAKTMPVSFNIRTDSQACPSATPLQYS